VKASRFRSRMSSSPAPPPFPPDSVYAGQYCEENIYHLADLFLKQPSIKDVWDVAVVFISNESKAVRLPTVLRLIQHCVNLCPVHAGSPLEPKAGRLG